MMYGEVMKPIFKTLQSNVNNILGEYAKAYVEINDFESLSLIAEIGNRTTNLFNELASTIRYEETSNKVNLEDAYEVQDAVVVEETVPVAEYDDDDSESDILKHDGVFEDMKRFIFFYIGSRGGKCSIAVLADAFHKRFNHLFNEKDYEIVSGSRYRWQHKMYDQVKTMRKQGLINPKAPGSGYHTYTLSNNGKTIFKNTYPKFLREQGGDDRSMEG